MKIRELQLKNIGVFDDEKIKFQECVKGKAEIHILTGKNGTGKTTVLMALASAFGFQGDFKTLLRNAFEKRFQKSTPQSGSYSVEVSFEEKIGNRNQKLESVIKESFFSIPIIERNNSLTEFSKLFLSETLVDIPLSFCTFAYSGYRRINDKIIEIGEETVENPLHQALDFIKNENSKFTVNQWLGQNLINSSLARSRGNHQQANTLANKVKKFEEIINDIVIDENQNDEVRFEMQSATKLVLIKNNTELDFDVLPDGLKSLISWIGDLLMRLDSLKWQDDLPFFEKNLILFLDEIEVHLHPEWQRKVLPVVQKLFKNAQIFVSTHSPFVVNSVDDAWVYELKLENGKAKVAEKSLTKTAYSYQTILREVFDIDERFGDGSGEKGTQIQLNDFYKQRDEILKSNGKSKINKKKFLEFAADLASQSAELQSLVFLELARLSNEKGEPYEI